VRSRGKKGNRCRAEGRKGIGAEQREEREQVREERRKGIGEEKLEDRE
jgi:hypothetical protein